MQQVERPPPKYVSPRWAWITKLVLRVASVVGLVVLAGLAGSMMSNPRIHVSSLLFVMVLPVVS
jgi:hypothetical protein